MICSFDHGCAHDLTAFREANIVHAKVILVIVCVDGDLAPASGNLTDVCEEVDLCAHCIGSEKKNCEESRAKHLANLEAIIDFESGRKSYGFLPGWASCICTSQVLGPTGPSVACSRKSGKMEKSFSSP